MKKTEFAGAFVVVSLIALVAVWGTSGCEWLIHDVSLNKATAGCGAVRPGPTMVRIDSPQGSYCIDSTEVTIAQFNEYIVNSGELIDVPEVCTQNQIAKIPDRNPSNAEANQPIRGLGVCHAWSYCKWAGKRLCGNIVDGGPTTFNNPANDEWLNACRNGKNATAFPYGDDYDPNICNTEGDGSVDVGSKKNCHGTVPPYDQVFDMSGNVAEFVNDFDIGATRARSGAWSDGKDDSCQLGAGSAGTANWVISAGGTIGIRCCANVGE